MGRESRRSAVLLLLMIGMRAWLISAEQAPWTMPEGMRSAILGVVDRALACGVPDTHGAQLLIGETTITFSAAVRGSSRPYSAGESSINLHLADGSWLLFGVIPFAQEQSGGVLDIRKLKPLSVDALAAMGLHPNGYGLPDWIDPSQRAMYTAAAGIDALLRGGLEGLRAAYLIRLGIPGAELAPIRLALDCVSYDVDELYWDAPLPIFLGPESEAKDALWRWIGQRSESLRNPTLSDPAKALRRVLFADAVQAAAAAVDPHTPQAFEPPLPLGLAIALGDARRTPDSAAAHRRWERIKSGGLKQAIGPPLPLRTAIALGDAMLTSDEAEAHRRWERIKSGLKVAPMGTDFASRLACWRGGPRRYPDLAEEHGTSYQVSDLDALVGLCADQRPSLWFDCFQPRTVGDQALRAISDLFQVDIRCIIGRDLLARWTDRERSETAAAVKSWWSLHRGESFDDLLVPASTQLTLTQLSEFLARLDAGHRRLVFDCLIHAWTKPPPGVGYEVGRLAEILALGLDYAPFASLVDTWTPKPDTRLMLAVWNQVRGRRAPFDWWLSDAVSQSAGKGDAASAWTPVWAPEWGVPVVMAYPTVERIHRMWTVMQAGPMNVSCANLIINIHQSREVPFKCLVEAAQASDPEMAKRIQAALVTLLVICLDDRRAAADQLRRCAASVYEKTIVDGKLVDVATHGRPIAENLRIADFAAFSVAKHLQDGDFAGSPLAAIPMTDLQFDCAAPLPERVAAAVRIRDRLLSVLPSMLEAAHLPADLLRASAKKW
jgi:hypothetical protein